MSDLIKSAALGVLAGLLFGTIELEGYVPATRYAPPAEEKLRDFDAFGRMRYNLRTLLFFLAVLPPLLAFGWRRYSEWRTEQERQKAVRLWRVDGVSQATP